MKKYLKFLFITLYMFLNLSYSVTSDEFIFEGEEIEILNEGKKLVSRKGVKVTTDDNTKITADEFEYDKEKNELLLQGNILIENLNNKTLIKANKIEYFKTLEKIITYGKTEVYVNNNYTISSSDITVLQNEGVISSFKNTLIKDKYKNNFTTNEFMFFVRDEVLKAKNVELIDSQGNISKLNSFFGNMKNGEYHGKDLKLNFYQKIFNNPENEPRLYGNKVNSNKNFTKISKGIFTTCKKREKCPPWVLRAEEVEHDKNKKIINYKKAWLEIYDQPVIYFPKFFHPDPSVKRQSGFLVPSFTDSGNTGASLIIPYFKVLDVNKDLTFQPRLFTNNNLMLQNEYRHIEKNLDHIMDFGLFTSKLNNDEESTKSHFFSNTIINFDSTFFGTSNLEINLEQVTNDTYLKKFKPKSNLITSENLMHSYLKYNGYEENSSLKVSVETYEDLTKKTSDRYEYIYPNIEFSKEFQKIDMPGSFSFNSSLFQKQFDTNKTKQSFINDIIYTSDTKYSEIGFSKDFKLLVKNPNTRQKAGSKDHADTDTKLLTKLMYSMTYPLKKEGEFYNSFLKPKISYRFSPNNTKNISNEDRRLDISNISSFNRLGISDGVEGGQSITTGLEFSLKDKIGQERISANLSQVIRDKANPDLPTNSTLNNKYSDIIGNLRFNLFDNLNFEYDFMMDNNLDKLNYNSVDASLAVNNFITTFQFLEEDGEVGNKSFISNQTKYSFDSNNSLSFATRRNKELNMTEFYNLVYQYENDCLRAAIEYNKNFYSDSDIKPEEEILFTLSIIPFSKFSSPNINK